VSLSQHILFVSIYVSTRRCSVIYLVPYIHSDNGQRLHSRGRTAAVLYEGQSSTPTTILHPADACLQRGAWVIMILVLRLILFLLRTFFDGVSTSYILGILVATTMAAMPTSILTPSRASIPVWPMSRRSQPPSTTRPTTGRLHRSVTVKNRGLIAFLIYVNQLRNVLILHPI